jgi:hypothetical protein
MSAMNGGEPDRPQRARMQAVLDFYRDLRRRLDTLAIFAGTRHGHEYGHVRDVLMACGTVSSDIEGNLSSFLQYGTGDVPDEFLEATEENQRTWIVAEEQRLRLLQTNRIVEEVAQRKTKKRCSNPVLVYATRHTAKGKFMENRRPNQIELSKDDLVMNRLYTVCKNLPASTRKPGPGKNPFPISDITFACLMMVYRSKSSRSCIKDLEQCKSWGLLRRMPYYNGINKYMRDSSFNSTLKSILRQSIPTVSTNHDRSTPCRIRLLNPASRSFRARCLASALLMAFSSKSHMLLGGRAVTVPVLCLRDATSSCLRRRSARPLRR